MIGIVAVSHSARLGEAALELALQMVRGGGARVKVAAGAGSDADGAPILGTDAVAVAAAIDEAERRARDAVPELTLVMYLEPDVDRGEAYVPAERPEPPTPAMH